MNTGSSQSTNSTSTADSTTSPWSESEPLLKNLVNDYSGLSANLTSDQATALNNLTGSAKNLVGLSTDTLYQPVTNGLSFNTQPEQHTLNSASDELKSNLNQTIDQSNLNPYKTPGFSDALGTLNQDITNSVKGTYAGSGRDPSGAGSFAQSLGRGLSQGEGSIIQNQFNTNRGAQNAASEALAGRQSENAATGAGLKTSDQNTNLNSLNYVGTAATDYMIPAETQLNAANTSYGQIFSNLQDLLTPSVTLGSMGSSTTGSGTNTGTTTTSSSALGNIIGGTIGGIGLLSKFSDERAKEDVAEVGKLHDGQKVYRFRYKGDPKMQIGLLAQEVAEHEPDSVNMHIPTGLLMVEHKGATDRAARMAH